MSKKWIKNRMISLVVMGGIAGLIYWIVYRDWESEMRQYWPVVGCVICLYLLGSIIEEWNERRGHPTFIQRIKGAVHRYRYLMKQLVLRDFKVKYKASVLGMLWSLLNPMLMTLVYYVVFSSLFSYQDNFIVYLMTGTILFNYFSEATSLGLNALTGNSGLITKVYMPKYIYPLSKVLSAAINLLIAMVPLLILIGLSGLPYTRALLLIPVLILFLVTFCAGVAFALSVSMVFFRDTQFLWGIVILMWNFLSPVFYPESIIPEAIMGVYRLNPIYQMMVFFRSITLYGVAPEPDCMLRCFLSAIIALMIGLVVFYSARKKITLYL